MEPDVYLRKHHIITYLEDATATLLAKRRKDRRLSPLTVLLDYFAKLRNETHVYGRDFSFVSATPYNRGAFIGTFWRCFYKLGQNNDLKMCAWEYHQLIQLLCSDFPTKYSDQACEIISHRKYGNLTPAKETKLTLAEFLYVFQVVFYYEEFLRACEEVYEAVSQESSAHQGSKSMSNVVMPPSKKDKDPSCGKTRGLHSSSLVTPSDGRLVSTEIFYPLVKDLCHCIEAERPWTAAPSVTAISEALKDSFSAISFEDFVFMLCSSVGINEVIHQLPPRDQFPSITPTTPTTPIAPTKGSEE